MRFSANEQSANPIYMAPGHPMEPSKPSSFGHDNPSYMSHPRTSSIAEDNIYSTIPSLAHSQSPSFIVSDDKALLVDNMEGKN